MQRIHNEHHSLLELGVLVPCASRAATTFSNWFPVIKPNKIRFVLDCDIINKSIVNPPHFKHDTIQITQKHILPGDFMVKIDITHAYYHIPISHTGQAFFGLTGPNGRLYRLAAAPMGYKASAHLLHILLMPLLSLLHKAGMRFFLYCDDIFGINQDEHLLRRQTLFAVQLLKGCGFLVNLSKCILEPTQRASHLGFSIDTQLFAAVNPERGEIEGFDVDMAKLVALAIFGGSWDAIGERLDLQGITYAQRIPKVAGGEVDLIAHTMTINCTRWQQVAFSGVYLYAGQRLLVARNSGVQDITELAGKTVCVSAGGTSADEMRSLAVDPPIEVVEVDNQTDCVVLFQQGRADAIRSDDTVLAGFAAQDPYAQLAGPLLTEEPYGMAMSLEHPEFVSFVNAVLEDAKLSANPYPVAGDSAAPAPGWRAIYDRWLSGLGQPVEKLSGNPDGSIDAPRGSFPLAVYGRPRPQG